MSQEIKNITVVSQPGVRYEIGDVCNGMLLDLIKHHDFDGVFSIYEGLTADDQIIFRIENCPVNVEYFPSIGVCGVCGTDNCQLADCPEADWVPQPCPECYGVNGEHHSRCTQFHLPF